MYTENELFVLRLVGFKRFERLKEIERVFSAFKLDVEWSRFKGELGLDVFTSTDGMELRLIGEDKAVLVQDDQLIGSTNY